MGGPPPGFHPMGHHPGLQGLAGPGGPAVSSNMAPPPVYLPQMMGDYGQRPPPPDYSRPPRQSPLEEGELPFLAILNCTGIYVFPFCAV